ncbi:hypothetical protein LINPERHAP1_LOCUS13130 [Linum perenne]
MVITKSHKVAAAFTDHKLRPPRRGSSVREMETSFEVLSVNGNKRWLKEEKENVLVVEEKSLNSGGGGGENQDEMLVRVRAFPRSEEHIKSG